MSQVKSLFGPRPKVTLAPIPSREIFLADFSHARRCVLAQRFARVHLVTCNPNVHYCMLPCLRRALRTAVRRPVNRGSSETRPERVDELLNKRTVAIEFLDERGVRPRLAAFTNANQAVAVDALRGPASATRPRPIWRPPVSST